MACFELHQHRAVHHRTTGARTPPAAESAPETPARAAPPRPDLLDIVFDVEERRHGGH